MGSNNRRATIADYNNFYDSFAEMGVGLGNCMDGSASASQKAHVQIDRIRNRAGTSREETANCLSH